MEINNGKKYISTNIFIPLYILVFTIILAMATLFNGAIVNQNGQIDKNRTEISDVKGDIKAININIANISKSIDEIKNAIKK